MCCIILVCVCVCTTIYRRLLYVFYYIMVDIGERAFELMFLVVTFAIPMKIKIIYHIYLSIRDIVRVGVAVRPYHLPTPKLTRTGNVELKAKIYEISSDTHQLHYIPLYHFTISIL